MTTGVENAPRFDVSIQRHTKHEPYLEYEGKLLYEKTCVYVVTAHATPYDPHRMGIIGAMPSHNPTFTETGEDLEELVLAVWRAFREHWKDHPAFQEEPDGDHQT